MEKEAKKQNEKTAVVLNNLTLDVPVEVREQIAQKIKELKASNNVKKVFTVIVQGETDSDEKPFYIAYFRRPNLMEFSQYMSFVQKDITQASKTLAQNTIIGGDHELVDDDELFLYGTMQQLGHIIDSRNSDIVKR